MTLKHSVLSKLFFLQLILAMVIISAPSYAQTRCRVVGGVTTRCMPSPAPHRPIPHRPIPHRPHRPVIVRPIPPIQRPLIINLNVSTYTGARELIHVNPQLTRADQLLLARTQLVSVIVKADAPIGNHRQATAQLIIDNRPVGVPQLILPHQNQLVLRVPTIPTRSMRSKDVKVLITGEAFVEAIQLRLSPRHTIIH